MTGYKHGEKMSGCQRLRGDVRMDEKCEWLMRAK